jgi:hypothetical protein
VYWEGRVNGAGYWTRIRMCLITPLLSIGPEDGNLVLVLLPELLLSQQIRRLRISWCLSPGHELIRVVLRELRLI